MSRPTQPLAERCLFCRTTGYICDRAEPKCGKCVRWSRRCLYDEAEASKPWGQPVEEKCLPCRKWGDRCDQVTPRCGACTKCQRICLRDGEEDQEDTKKQGYIRQAFEESQARLLSLPRKAITNPDYQRIQQIAQETQGVIHTAVVVNSTSVQLKFILAERPKEIMTSILLRKGQQGHILGDALKDTEGRNWRLFTDTKIGATGFVLDEWLNIGIAARGWVQIVDPGAQQLNRPFSDAAPGLQKTVRTLWSVILAEKSTYLTLGGSHEVIKDLEELGAQAEDALLRGMPLPLRQLIDKGEFTFHQVFNLPHHPALDVLHHPDMRQVIYLLCFNDIDQAILAQHDDIFYDGAHYVGKTENASTRKNNHWKALNNPSSKGQLYTIGSHASPSSRRFMIVTDVTAAGHNNLRQKRIMRILEQTVVCLFKTTTPLLLSHPRAVVPVVNRYYDTIAAQFFRKVTQIVFPATSWKPSIALGLNWKSPMMEHLVGHTSWTRQDCPLNDKIYIREYRRGGLTVHENGVSGGLCLLHGGSDGAGRVWVTIPKDSGISAGSRVFPVVEIAVGGFHPNPWACAPVPGPWSDWEILNRVAIRIEWQDAAGQWFTRWLHNKHFFRKLGWPVKDITRAGPGYHNVNTAYVTAIGVYNALMQAYYPNGADVGPWVKRSNKITVKVFKYNHLAMVVDVSDQVPEGVIVVPRLRTFIENEIFIDRAFNSGGNVIIGMPPQGEDHCDMCRKLCHFSTLHWACPVGFSKNNCQCEPIDANTLGEPHGRTCSQCAFMRRPCTWTKASELVQLYGKYRHIRRPHRFEPDNIAIPGPSFVERQGHCATVEELEEDGEEAQTLPGDEDLD